MKNKEITCCGCNNELLSVETFYGSYNGDKLIDGVCIPCHKKGVRTKAQKEFYRRKKTNV